MPFPVVNLTKNEEEEILDHINEFKLKYGQDFFMDIHEADEMYTHFFHLHKDKDWTNTKLRAYLSYFSVGGNIFNSLNKFFKKNGGLKNFTNILDFASGYGRLTRVMNAKLKKSTISVAEIDHDAVDFLSGSLGLTGYKTTQNPSDFETEDRFDLIICISLFSHLSIEYWDEWFVRLIGVLKPGGKLLITTHNIDLIKHLDILTLQRLKVNKHFYYHTANETNERLKSDYYGSTYVSETFLSKRAKKFDLGFDYAYKGLGDFQDIACFTKA